MVKDSKTKRMEETLWIGILGPGAWEKISPHVPAGGLKIDPAKMKAIFETLPKQEVDAIAARASKSSAPEAKVVLEAIKGIR